MFVQGWMWSVVGFGGKRCGQTYNRHVVGIETATSCTALEQVGCDCKQVLENIMASGRHVRDDTSNAAAAY